MEKEEWLTPKEYAERYKLSYSGVVALCKKQALPSIKCGSAWRIKAEAPNQSETTIKDLVNQALEPYITLTKALNDALADFVKNQEETNEKK
jgi:excisionase family DNA binding protein